MSALPVRSKGRTVWLPRLALLQSANVFLFQGERGADGEVGLPVTMDCNKEKVDCFEFGAFSPLTQLCCFIHLQGPDGDAGKPGSSGLPGIPGNDVSVQLFLIHVFYLCCAMQVTIQLRVLQVGGTTRCDPPTL